MAALSDIVRIDVAFADSPFSTPTVWTDITGDVRSLKLVRARSEEAGGRIDPSKLTVEVNNDTLAASGAGAWDRNNPASPYGTNIKRNRRIRVVASDDAFASERNLFVGFLDNVRPASTRFFSEAIITAGDALRFLRFDLEDVERPEEFTGERAEAAVDAAGVPAGLKGTFDHGTVHCAAATINATAINVCQEMQQTEIGVLYCDNNGLINFRDRYAVLADTAWSTSQLALGSIIAHRRVSSTQGGFAEITRATASGATGRTFAYDATAANEAPLTKQRNGGANFFDADSLIAAESWQKGWDFSSQRPDTVVVQPLAGSAALTAVTDGSIELLNRVSLSYQPVGWAAPYAYEARIESIEHTISGAQGAAGWETLLRLSPHQTTWQTESADWYQFGTATTATSVPAL